MSGQRHMSSDSVVTNLLLETGRIIPVTRDEAIKMSTKASKVFKIVHHPKDEPGPIHLHVKEWLKSLTTNKLDKTRDEGFKSKFTKACMEEDNIHPWFKRSWQTYNSIWTSREKPTLGYHSRFPTGPIQSTNQPINRCITPRNRNLQSDLREMGKLFTNKMVIEPKQSVGTSCTIYGKGHGPSSAVGFLK